MARAKDIPENGAVTATGAAAFAELLSAYSATNVFFVPTVLLRTLAELESRGIKPISAHGEKAAAYMADGYARVSGKPGFCMAQAVGAANLAAGLKDAYMASSPVIAITGGPYPETRHRHVYQEIDDSRMFGPVTKWSATIDTPGRIPELIRQAYRAATSGCPGPVHLEARGHMGEVFDGTVALGDVVAERRFATTPPFRPEPESCSIHEAVGALSAARRPVIVAGGGVIRSRGERDLVALAERLDVPVATSLNGKASIPDDHPLAVGVVGTYARRCANEVLAAADVVFFAGSRAGGMTTNKWTIPRPGTTVIQLDLDPAELGRSYPLTVALMGDARATFQRMLAAAEPCRHSPWVAHVQARVGAWHALLTSETLNSVPIRPELICSELGSLLPDDAIVVADTLQASLWTGSFLRLTSPAQAFIRCAGSLGWGLPASIGAKCAAADRPVVCVTGDGGIYYHLSELETAARYGINVVVIINNNGAYGSEAKFWRDAYANGPSGQARDMWTFGDIDFARIALEFGCSGVRVRSPHEFRPALEKALSGNLPAVLDVVTDPAAIADKGW